MVSRVLIVDTSVLCCWLRVPGKDEAGPVGDRWKPGRIDALLDAQREKNYTFVLPLATLIETGNHIAQAPARRFECAQLLANCLKNASDAQSPWAAFTDQSLLWEAGNLHQLAASWPSLAAAGLSIGDATIKDVAEYYAKGGFTVEILTADVGLKSYEPIAPAAIPRRRR